LHFDYNGDGYGDLALLVQTNEMLIHGRPVVLLGGPDGISASMDRRLILGENLPIYGIRVFSPIPSVRLALVGDLNGDGLSDLLLKHYDATNRMNLRLYYGSRSGAGQIILLRTQEGAVDWGEIYPVPVGDFNQDGFADLAVIHVQREAADRRATSGIDSFFMGAPQNPEHVNFMLPRPHRAENWFVSPWGDMDGDRHPELLLYSPERQLHLVEFENTRFGVRELLTPDYQPLDFDSLRFTPACDVNGDGYSDLVHTSFTFADITTSGPNWSSTVVLGSNGAFQRLDIGLLRSRLLFCNSAGQDGRSVVLSRNRDRFRATGFPEWTDENTISAIRGLTVDGPSDMDSANDYDRNGESDVALRRSARATSPPDLSVLEVFHSRSG
jgi:hypothetical protein